MQPFRKCLVRPSSRQLGAPEDAFRAPASSHLDSGEGSANNGSVSEHRFEIIDEQRRFEVRDPRPFDRIQFAMWALRILRPDMTVAVYERRRELHIERGRDLARGAAYTRALVGIPPDATREHIAFALAELAGVADRPFVVDLLARLASAAA